MAIDVVVTFDCMYWYGETMSFEDGYAYIYSHIQEERIRFIYQCGARHALFEDVLVLVA